MTDEGADDLQFENAEYETPAPSLPACAICRRPIPDAYFELGGSIFCDACRGAVLSSREGGSGLARFLRAGLYGAAAAAAGFAVYFGVLRTTGLEIGLISILVGLMVGKAVHKGSNGRGGWVYQSLAVFLTYTAVAASYSALVIPHLLSADLRARNVARQNPAAPAKKAEGAKPVAAANGDDPAKPVGAAKGVPKVMGGEPAKNEVEAADPDAAPEDARDGVKDPNPLKGLAGGNLALAVVIAFVVVVGFIYAIPVIAGFSSPIGLLIIGFALWEAWKLNRRVRLVFNGPFAVGAGAVSEAPGDA